MFVFQQQTIDGCTHGTRGRAFWRQSQSVSLYRTLDSDYPLLQTSAVSAYRFGPKNFDGRLWPYVLLALLTSRHAVNFIKAEVINARAITSHKHFSNLISRRQELRQRAFSGCNSEFNQSLHRTVPDLSF